MLEIKQELVLCHGIDQRAELAIEILLRLEPRLVERPLDIYDVWARPCRAPCDQLTRWVAKPPHEVPFVKPLLLAGLDGHLRGERPLLPGELVGAPPRVSHEDPVVPEADGGVELVEAVGELVGHVELLDAVPLVVVGDLGHEGDAVVGEAAADGRADDDAAPGVGPVAAEPVPVVPVAEARVVGPVHEADGAVVAEADHLQLGVGEGVGLVLLGGAPLPPVEGVLAEAAAADAGAGLGLAPHVAAALDASPRGLPVLLAAACAGHGGVFLGRVRPRRARRRGRGGGEGSGGGGGGGGGCMDGGGVAPASEGGGRRRGDGGEEEGVDEAEAGVVGVAAEEARGLRGFGVEEGGRAGRGRGRHGWGPGASGWGFFSSACKRRIFFSFLDFF